MKNILIGVGAVAVIALVGYILSSSTNSSDVMMNDEAMKKDSAMMQKDATADDKMMMEKKDVMIDDKMMMQKGSYVAYDASTAMKVAQSGKAILFFHAPWCPTCRAADADILKNAANIPSGTTIFKVDYDTSSEMKKKYSVTTQHTFVQIDANMTSVKTWRSSTTLESILTQVK